MTHAELAEALLPVAKSDNDMKVLIMLSEQRCSLTEDPICRMAQDSPWQIRKAWQEMALTEVLPRE